MSAKEENENQIPAGYVQDRKGSLVPLTKVKDIDKERDKLVRGLIKKGLKVSGQIADYREDAFDQIAAFAEKSAAKYNTRMGGKKGNMTLFSYDGQYKIMVAQGQTVNFDERLQIAKSLVDECIQEWMKGSNKNIQALVEQAFEVDKQGKVSVDRILGLRKLDIKDDRWEKAMDAIADAMQVTDGKRYIRLYERDGESEEYRPISLDAASA